MPLYRKGSSQKRHQRELHLGSFEVWVAMAVQLAPGAAQATQGTSLATYTVASGREVVWGGEGATTGYRTAGSACSSENGTEPLNAGQVKRSGHIGRGGITDLVSRCDKWAPQRPRCRSLACRSGDQRWRGPRLPEGRQYIQMCSYSAAPVPQMPHWAVSRGGHGQLVEV